jgi:hypothetical protein
MCQCQFEKLCGLRHYALSWAASYYIFECSCKCMFMPVKQYELILKWFIVALGDGSTYPVPAHLRSRKWPQRPQNYSPTLLCAWDWRNLHFAWSTQYQLRWMMVRVPSRCTHYVQGKSLRPRPGIEPWFHGRPVRGLVTIPGSIQIRFNKKNLNGGEKCINKWMSLVRFTHDRVWGDKRHNSTHSQPRHLVR